ncbi:MAG: ABC transporter ATP-binding protein [Planctomycetaceae bacterium]|nr:ABC transporter ATP-binding protein [Planctomycetaceae bacterium]
MLDVRGLTISLLNPATGVYQPIVAPLDVTLSSGQALGITGISGGGKSTLVRALSGQLPATARIEATTWKLFRQDVIGPNTRRQISGRALNRRVRQIAGRRLFFIHQDARTALVPYRTIEWHLRRAALPARPSTSDLQSVLADMGIPSPIGVLKRYPRELSGGECQRIQLAIARWLPIELMIADEPFSFVHRERAGKLVQLLRSRVEKGNGLVFVSHHLDVLRELTDHTAVLCNGALAEWGPTETVLNSKTSCHPHTRLLLRLGDPDRRTLPVLQCQPHSQQLACVFAGACDLAREACDRTYPSSQSHSGQHRVHCLFPEVTATPQAPLSAPQDDVAPASEDRFLIRAENVVAAFSSPSLWNRETDTILSPRSLSIHEGECLGLRGESGCGKTTMARVIMGLHPIRSGTLARFGVSDLSGNLSSAAQRRLWHRTQWISQDSDVAFDPLANVEDSLAQAFLAAGVRPSQAELRRLCDDLLSRLRLPARLRVSLTGNLSGGERRRLAILRALAAFGFPAKSQASNHPRLLILDEPTVGIDLFLQAFLRELLREARQQLGLTYLLISHDEQFLGNMCDREIFWSSRTEVPPQQELNSN